MQPGSGWWYGRFWAWSSILRMVAATPRRGNGKCSSLAPMNYRSLREFLARLEAEGDLVRVSAPVSTVLEMTEIQTRLLAERGPAVIFENPIKADGTRSTIPVLVNLFGTVKRVAMAVTLGGVERSDAKSLREVGELLATLRQPDPPRSIGQAFEMLPLAKTFMAMKPKTVGRPPCQQIVLNGAAIALSRLPIQPCVPYTTV